MTAPSPSGARARIDACVHCGLCLPACPTYSLTGDELDSPRGRIDLVRGLVGGSLAGTDVVARHLDRCLGCRACETACPSGVAYGEILSSGRAALAPGHPPAPAVRAILAAFASPARTTWAMRLAALARLPVVRDVAAALPGSWGAAARLAPAARWTPWSRTAGPVLAADPPRRGAVALLPGCVMDQAFAPVHAASAALLRRAGWDVLVPRGPLCCGALHAHVGETVTAGRLAERLAAALPAGADALVTDAAGCGSHLKETPGPWAGRVFDVLEFLDDRGIPGDARPVAAAFGVTGRRLRVAWADPCHLLHGQRVREAPRRLLAAIPDAELVPLRDADRCCGSAGVHNIAQPGAATALVREKVAAIADAAPDVLVSANPGCQIQIAAGLRAAGMRVRVLHAVELLATSRVAGFVAHG